MKKLIKMIIGLFSKPEDLDPIIDLQESLDQLFALVLYKNSKKFKEDQKDIFNLRVAEIRFKMEQQLKNLVW